MTKDEYNKLVKEIRDTRERSRAIIRKIQAEDDIPKLGDLFDELRETNSRLVELKEKENQYLSGKLDEFSNALKGIF